MTTKIDPEAVRRNMLRDGEVALSLTATDGEWPHEVRLVAHTLSALDRLLRALAKDVAPETPMVPVLVRVDILDAVIRFVVRLDSPRKRSRKRKPEGTP